MAENVLDTGFDLKTILSVMIVVSVVTGGNLWLNRNSPPLGYERYSNFGFSFDYPRSMVLNEQGIGLNGAASEFSGIVQGTSSEENSIEVIGVIWLTFNPAPELETVLDDVFAQLEEGLEIEGRDQLVTSMKDDQEMLTQFFNLNDHRTRLTGIVGTWFNPESNRVYMLFYIGLSDATSHQDLQNNFGKLLGSFSNYYTAAPRKELESYWPTQAWRTAAPEDVGLDSAKLDEMVEYIQEHEIEVDSVTVIRDGYMVMDTYFSPFNEGEKHIIYSCTKSVVSTLIGIALEEGYIESLDQRMLDFFPGRTVQNLDPWKEAITLRDLLTMTAGFDARDSYLYNWERLERMHESDDAVQYVLDLPMAEEPGTRFEYTNGVSHLISCIITETTGRSALEFAEEYLFSPLGITDVEWRNDSLGRNWGYNSLYLRPHDMAKIGYLFLNEGQWDGEQIVSKEWIEDATKKHIDATIVDGYGYQWWVKSSQHYLAIGYKGQFIHVIPDLRLVVVLTGNNAEDFDTILNLTDNYIIPSVTS